MRDRFVGDLCVRIVVGTYERCYRGGLVLHLERFFSYCITRTRPLVTPTIDCRSHMKASVPGAFTPDGAPTLVQVIPLSLQVLPTVTQFVDHRGWEAPEVP